MFKVFFLSELKYRFKQPMVYIFLALVTLLIFGATSFDNVQVGGSIGNVYRNSPFVITQYTTIMTIFGLLMATAFFNGAALKDYGNGFNEILFSSPISKKGFYFGRFLGALITATVPMLGVFLGVLLGSIIAPAVGWIDPDKFGSINPMVFVSNYFIFILPNMFFAGVIIYALALKWKSTVVSFVGAMVIIVGYMTAKSFMSDIDSETMGALLDTFGTGPFKNYTKYFTTVEKNTIILPFSGVILYNRLIWVGLGFVILFASYFNFSFQEKNKKVKKVKEQKSVTKTVFIKPTLTLNTSQKGTWNQFVSFFKINFLSIVKSVTFKILFLFGFILNMVNLIQGFEFMGLKSYPVTYKMISAISSSTMIFILIILVFFSGELIWRDRESKINEVIDSTPHASFISMFAKSLSLVATVTIMQWFFIFIAICYQLINGFSRIELDVYFLDFMYSLLPLFIVWSGVMILIQVLLNNKYLAYFASILVIFVLNLLLSAFDVETKMLNLASSPMVYYSDMNGFGPGATGAFWFNIYWILFSVICLLIAGMLWNRGIATSLMARIKKGKKEIPKSYVALFVIVGALWVSVAGFVYYNTQVLNTYKTSDETELLQANYEKKYKKYENVNLPKITKVNYFIDIFPEERGMDVRALMVLTNETHSPIDSIHIGVNGDWETTFNIPNSKLVLNDDEFDYLIYKLDKALQPHESIEIEIFNKYETKGFGNTRGSTSIVKNGTFVNNGGVLPSLGYQSSMELRDKYKRKKYDLAEKERMPALEEHCTGSCMTNYLTDGHSDFIDVETVISTSKDQVAIAPGSLIKQWEENGRNYYHYKVDQISQNFYSFISARYKIATRKWNGIDLEVYYDEKHGVNVEMMLDAVERSLAYYTKNFGPYYHKQCRIIEFPGYSTFAQAFPGTMPYSESFGFLINLEDKTENNVIDAVISHEMAHQWWAHQVVGAKMQGGTMMSESFAEYSSLMTLKHLASNPMKMRKFIKYDHDRYLRGRSREEKAEQPLFKVENQQYIHYGKGSVILYALQDYIGEEKVNLAMKNFLDEFKYKAPPYPTSLDFLRHLEPQVPDSMKYLINDWFKEITLYDNRVSNSTYKSLGNGKYEVKIDVEAVKLKADSLGVETIKPINDWIDLGVFSDSDEEHLIFQKRVKIDQQKMTFTFEVDTVPARASIDPRMLLIDRVYKDNSKKCVEE